MLSEVIRFVLAAGAIVFLFWLVPGLCDPDSGSFGRR